MIERIEPVANHDSCGRCGRPHGGNNHLCPVHGAVSAGCCETTCDPAGYVFCAGVGPVHRRDFAPAGWRLVSEGRMPWYVANREETEAALATLPAAAPAR
jgi:hypothetical protein